MWHPEYTEMKAEVVLVTLLMPPSDSMHVFRADFWEGDATKHFSLKKKDFQ